MKKITAVGIFVVLFSVTGALPAQEYKGPKIAVNGERYDFGKVAQGTQASHTFEVRNAGSEPLVIERVQSS